MNNNKKLHWVPDLPDYRDYLYAAAPTMIPDHVDLRQYCSPVEDQGELGSCTGNSIAGMLEILENKRNEQFVDLSRLFIYYNERLMEHTVRKDSGAYIRDGIKTIAKTGVCSEKLWPYDISKFKRRPVKAAYAEAATRKITEYKRIATFDDMIGCLAEGFPFVFGFAVYSNFMTQTVANTGMMPMPAGQCEGGHAVCAVGYDKTRKVVIVRNSWGTGWGDKGYFYMPFAYIQNFNLCDDFWTVR